MKTNLLFSLMLLLYTAFSVGAQNTLRPAPIGTAPIPFGKKLPPPASALADEMRRKVYDTKMNDIPYTTFDATAKKFIRHSPGQGMEPSYQSSNHTNNLVPLVNRPNNPPSGFHLTKDINVQTGDAYPANNPANSHYNFAVLNNVSYFFAGDGINGRELWRSDGTTAGTYMLKDINPGLAGSDGDGIIAANGLLFFSAITPDEGAEPWVSDGTSAGTHLLMDINTGLGFSSPNQFVNVNGSVFFCASLFAPNNQLWKTDGTSTGTTLITDLAQFGIGNSIYELIAVNDMAYFIANTFNSGYQLFRSDGTDPGTYMVKQIGYYNYDGIAPMQLTAYNNQLFFSADDGTGRKLWTSDGSFDGTNYAPGNNDILMQVDYTNIYNNAPFRILSNVLYIAGYTFLDGGGLYKYDALNNPGVVLVKDLTDLPDDPYDNVLDFVVAVDITIVKELLYFKVISNINGSHDELWKTDGDPNHTTLVKTIGPGDKGVFAYNFYNNNGTLVFVVHNDLSYGDELWKSDGTDAGTVMVKDIFIGKASSYPDDLTFCNGKLLFRAIDIDGGNELWSSDGSAAGTKLVKDINSGTTNGSDAGYMFKGIIARGNEVLFNAFTPALGGELYKSDGTAAGTKLLNDIYGGTDWAYPNSFINKNNLTYFVGDDAVGTALYKTDGTKAGLGRITDYINRDVYYVLNFNVTDKGLALYTLVNRATGANELWRSDGTPAGTYLLTPNLPYSYSNYITTIGNTAFFIAGDNTTGYELWKTDGTIPGTMMVKDINPGFNGSDPYSLFVYKNHLYFGAYDGFSAFFHRSLWKSDGTEKGTKKLINLEPTFYSSTFNTEPQHVFCESNGLLYFTAYDFNTYGNELFKTNGNAAKTAIVKDISPYSSSFPDNLTNVNGVLYFTADDGMNGTELWSTNGKPKKTNMVKDITPDFFGSSLRNLCSAGGRLYFLNNTSFPNTLWSSGGTADNTEQVADPGLDGLTDLISLTPAGKKLFFGAYTAKYGRELYEGDASGDPFVAVRIISTDAMAPKINGELDVMLYPNPAQGNTTLQIKGDTKTISIIITDAAGKTILQKSYIGQRSINLPVEKLAAGIYMVTIKNDQQIRTVQFIKK